MSVLQRGGLFLSAAEYFGQSGRIILERVGNTALNSNSTVSEDAGIVLKTVATSALAVRRSNHSARSHPQIGYISQLKLL
jgi:hypothetical protein